MRYLILACDYDGTLASAGQVSRETLAALEQVVASGRKIFLVTGRRLDDLETVFPQLHLFDRIVAENGALLYHPATKEVKLLGEAPPKAFIQRLNDLGIPISVGHVIVATWSPHETASLKVIHELGLEWQVIFNKGAVMMLPSGVNKGTGLAATLEELGYSPHNVVGVGDAENDHAFLSLCECAVAVANALPMVQQRADLVTEGRNGQGCLELMNQLLADDLNDADMTRHYILLGTKEESGKHTTLGGKDTAMGGKDTAMARHATTANKVSGNGQRTGKEAIPGGRDSATAGKDAATGNPKDTLEVRINPHGTNIMIAGSSGSGKSTATAGLLERLGEAGYQFCIIDPEGDYESFEGAVVLGDRKHVPAVEEIIQLLSQPGSNVVINLLGVPLEDRPAFFSGLLPRLLELRARTGHPHWLVLDETHHLLPKSWKAAGLDLQHIEGMVFITVHPDQVSREILSAIDIILVIGEAPDETLKKFNDALEQTTPLVAQASLETGEALVWLRREGTDPFRCRLEPPKADRRRHSRKYAEGELGPDKSFYFQGPEKKLNLRAQNLIIFLQLADGVDDATWLYHLERHDYSKWFRAAIKNDKLADQAYRIEERTTQSAAESKALIKKAIEDQYTLPPASPVPLHPVDPAIERHPR